MDGLGLRPLSSLRHLETHSVALVEGFEAPSSYAGVVDENVFSPAIRLDEAVAHFVGKPLYRSLGHLDDRAFLFRLRGTRLLPL
jgi:hypothetical protein